MAHKAQAREMAFGVVIQPHGSRVKWEMIILMDGFLYVL